ncbi:MAG: hypothetical protein Q9190_005661 [Brigantiaea leucoxantha]
MDEFAQTREPDTLFDDDFTPITEPAAQQPVPRHNLTRDGHGDRGRGRGRGRAEPISKPQHPQNPTTPQRNNAPPTAPATDAEATPKAPLAVRGDRSATGGNLKPKLTEEELSARLEAARLNSAKREEAHRLAEADEASFQQREAQASQKRQEESRARRIMDQERERNRLRKLGAQGGREWDEGKEEQEPARGSQYRRGASGGVAYQGGGYRGNNFGQTQEDDRSARGLGFRGGRGRGIRSRGGRGRGRGIQNGDSHVEILKPPPPNIDTDFPALPNSKAGQATVEIPTFKSPAGEKQSWADEVEVQQPAAT